MVCNHSASRALSRIANFNAAAHAPFHHFQIFLYLRPFSENHQFGAERMDEKRKHPRTEIDEPAYVSSGGSVMRCVVRNISPEGAAIDVENPAFVPPSF